MIATLITVALVTTVAVPLLVSLLLAVAPIRNERAAARIALGAAALSTLATLAAVTGWVWAWAHGGSRIFHSPAFELFSRGSYRFTFELVFDTAAAVFLGLVQFTSGTVMRFSRVYLHREPGFRRFFVTILMFQGAMSLLALAANLDLMFAAWEIVGAASFLLIAFYRERRSPARNALKTYSIYRVADIGMLIAAYLEHAQGHDGIGFFILLAAAGKSAQFPFSYWIVRAMEGPTPSSALFYGALSVNAGAYLLLRTYPLWGGVAPVCICVGAVGLLSAALCTLFGRVQHTIKGQVGYASATQVGLIFLELALGLKSLALFHMVSNALLRCYQLLISPSAVAYLLRQQSSARGTAAVDASSFFQRFLPERVRSTVYVFAMSEGYLEAALVSGFWRPLRAIGARLARLGFPVLAAAAALGLAGAFWSHGLVPVEALPLGAALLAIATGLSASAIGEWQNPSRALAWVTGSGILAALAVDVAAAGYAAFAAAYYAAGIGLSGALALVGIGVAVRRGSQIPRFAGLSDPHPVASYLVLAGALGLAGFTFLPTFLGEGILLSAAFASSRVLAFALAGLFALNGFIAVRVFAFVFFGRAWAQPAVAADLSTTGTNGRARYCEPGFRPVAT